MDIFVKSVLSNITEIVLSNLKIFLLLQSELFLDNFNDSDRGQKDPGYCLELFDSVFEETRKQ